MDGMTMIRKIGIIKDGGEDYVLAHTVRPEILPIDINEEKTGRLLHEDRAVFDEQGNMHERVNNFIPVKQHDLIGSIRYYENGVVAMLMQYVLLIENDVAYTQIIEH